MRLRKSTHVHNLHHPRIGGPMTNVDSFAGRLLPGEKLLWTGRPSGGLLLTSRDVFLIPFSFLWCGFVIFWILGAARTGGGAFMLIGIAFLCVGLFFTLGRFVFDAWLRSGTRYGLTDRRVLILRTSPSTNFTSVALDRLPEVQFSERADGRGTIRFGQQQGSFGFSGRGLSTWTPSLDPIPQFLAIPNAKQVFDLVQNAAARSR
jgi:hypothetical protein